jgi:hypothetical protein
MGHGTPAFSPKCPEIAAPDDLSTRECLHQHRRGHRYGALLGVDERLEKRAGVGRQGQSAIVSAPGLLPAFLRNKQLLATAKCETVLDPYRAVAQRPTQVQKRRDLAGGEGAFAIFARERSTPNAAQGDREPRREYAQVAFVTWSFIFRSYARGRRTPMAYRLRTPDFYAGHRSSQHAHRSPVIFRSLRAHRTGI